MLRHTQALIPHCPISISISLLSFCLCRFYYSNVNIKGKLVLVPSKYVLFNLVWSERLLRKFNVMFNDRTNWNNTWTNSKTHTHTHIYYIRLELGCILIEKKMRSRLKMFIKFMIKKKILYRNERRFSTVFIFKMGNLRSISHLSMHPTLYYTWMDAILHHNATCSVDREIKRPELWTWTLWSVRFSNQLCLVCPFKHTLAQQT